MAEAEIAVVQWLEGVTLFAGLGPEELAELAAVTTLYTASPGELLFREQDPGDCMYVVALGQVVLERQVPDGVPLRLAALGPGQFFGEMALFGDVCRSASARIGDERTTLLELSREAFERLVRQHVAIPLRIIACLVTRLRETTERVVAIDQEARRLAPDLHEIIEEEYPHPIALVAQEMEFAADPGTRLRRMLELTETVLMYQNALVKALYLDGEPTSAEIDLMLLRGGTLGSMHRFLQVALGFLVDTHGRGGLAAALHGWFFRNRGKTSSVMGTLSEIIATRNAIKHGSEAALDDTAATALVTTLTPKVTFLLESLDFLRAHPLVHVQAMGFRDGTFQYSVLGCRGAFRAFRTESFEHGAPLETQRLYVLEGEHRRPLAVHPWMGLYRCEVCGDRDVFLTQRWSRRDVTGIEFGRGHRHVSKDVGTAVERLYEKLEARVKAAQKSA
ncbi:MAG: cyclic nucleotide-binding domain-containing protein [Polyangiaceae bacterium]|nr:cyclic nucleotide-binding domain-containing protein [Polyangiaceae bacterium]